MSLVIGLILASINAYTPWWLGLFGGSFFALEGAALYFAHKGKQPSGVPGMTLSALVWRFINWKGSTGHKVARFGFAAFYIDLGIHFFFRTQLTPWG
jgi:hypothetical protein